MSGAFLFYQVNDDDSMIEFHTPTFQDKEKIAERAAEHFWHNMDGHDRDDWPITFHIHSVGGLNHLGSFEIDVNKMFTITPTPTPDNKDSPS